MLQVIHGGCIDLILYLILSCPILYRFVSYLYRLLYIMYTHPCYTNFCWSKQLYHQEYQLPADISVSEVQGIKASRVRSYVGHSNHPTVVASLGPNSGRRVTGHLGTGRVPSTHRNLRHMAVSWCKASMVSRDELVFCITPLQFDVAAFIGTLFSLSPV